MESYYIVKPKVHYIYFILGLLGLGFLGTYTKHLDGIWFGYIAAGIMLFLSFDWEYVEK